MLFMKGEKDNNFLKLFIRCQILYFFSFYPGRSIKILSGGSQINKDSKVTFLRWFALKRHT